MMKFKSTFILLAVFLGLLLIVLFYGNDNAERNRIESNLSKPLFKSSQLDKITEVSFLKPGQPPIVLMNDLEGWHIEDSMVDPDEVNTLKKSLTEFPTGRRASKNKESWEGYGLTEASQDQVVLKQGETTLASLYLGAPGPSYPSFYMRRDEDVEVYLVTSNLQQLVDYDATRWKDKRLFVLDKNKIQKISVRLGEEHWAFANVEGVWNLISDLGSTPLSSPEDLQKYLDDLISVKGISIEPNAGLFKQADNAIAFTMDDGREIIVSVSRKDDKESLVQITGRIDLLRLNSDLSARLRPSFLDAKEPEPAKSENVK